MIYSMIFLTTYYLNLNHRMIADCEIDCKIFLKYLWKLKDQISAVYKYRNKSSHNLFNIDACYYINTEYFFNI
jgi:hypothetical protein